MAPHVGTLTRYAAEATSIVEFGVRGGVSTWALLDGLPGNGRLWSVDIDDCTVPDRVRDDSRWTFIVGDDRECEVLDRLPKSADLVFIDTSHEYEHTALELAYAFSLRPRRIVCHDAEWPGVARAMLEFCMGANWRIAAYDEASDERGSFSLATLEPE